MQCSNIAVPIALIGISGSEGLFIPGISVNQKALNGGDANIKVAFCNHGQK